MNIGTAGPPVGEIQMLVRQFAIKEVQPRIGRLDSADSETAWRELLPVAGSIGLLDFPVSMDSQLSIGTVLEEMSRICPGAAAGFWAHYVAFLPSLFTRTPSPIPTGDSPLLSTGPLSPADADRDFVFGSTLSTEAITYFENDTHGGFVRQSLEKCARHDGQLGVRACTLRSCDPRQGLAHFPTLSRPDARSLLARVESTAHLWLSSIAVGNAFAALDRARSYTSERYQGGGPLSENPVIRRVLNRMEMQLTAAASYLNGSYDGVGAIQGDRPTGGEHTGSPLRRVHPSHVGSPNRTAFTKVFATETGERVCSDAVQCLGGYGYMKDYGLEKRLRDAKCLCVLGGTNPDLLGTRA